MSAAAHRNLAFALGWICALAPTTPAQTTNVVINLDDSGLGSLRQAILDLNEEGGGKVVFSNVVGRIMLASELPEFQANINIVGPGPSRVHLTGNNLAYAIAVSPNSTSSIRGLSFSNFVAARYGNGAAISNGGSLTVSACSFVDNSTRGFGGAIYNSGVLEAKSCSFTGNVAKGGAGEFGIGGSPGGGGAGLGGALFSSGRALLSACQLTLNSALGGDAGGGVSTNLGGGNGGGSFGGIGGTTNGNINGSAGGFGSGGGGGAGQGNDGFPCGDGGDGGFGAGGGSGIQSYPFGCRSTSGNPGKFGGIGGGGAGIGGAIFVEAGTLLMSDCVLASNRTVGGRAGGSAVGGAVFLHSGSASLTNCSFVGNNCQASDGGVGDVGHFGESAGDALGAGAYLSSGAMSVFGCSLVGNRVQGGNGGSGSRGSGGAGLPGGGGLYCEGGTVLLLNSTVSGNRAEAGNNGNNGLSGEPFLQFGGSALGAGICVATGQVTIASSTIVYNEAVGGLGVPDLNFTNVQGHGLGGGIANGRGTVLLASAIVWGNTGVYAGSFPDLWGTFISSTRNLFGITNGATGWSSSDLLNVDPKLGPLQDNGGPTLTHALLAGSPAIDAGASSGLITDQRGQPRPIDVPNIPNLPGSDGTDIGAVELDPVLRATGVRRSGNDILVGFTSVSDKSYFLEYKSNVDGATWSALPGGVQGSGGIVTGKDVGAAALPRRFYRIRTQ